MSLASSLPSVPMCTSVMSFTSFSSGDGSVGPSLGSISHSSFCVSVFDFSSLVSPSFSFSHSVLVTFSFENTFVF